jgi:hypothetical protein
MHGTAGAAIAFAFSKYLKLSKPAQVLLSLAGFGIGKYLLDETRKHDKFLQYDPKHKVYNLKD